VVVAPIARSLRIAALLALCAALLGADVDYPTYEKPEPEPPIDYPAAGAKIFDGLVLRPLGAGAAVVGAGAFLLTAPISAWTLGLDAVWTRLVLEPFDFAFRRPLGEF
jgi:hypothetical protein